MGWLIWYLWVSYVKDIGAEYNFELIECQKAMLKFERDEVAAKGDLSVAADHQNISGELSIANQKGQLTDTKKK